MYTDVEIAARFESLGGGADHRDKWAFGCEFGFYQQAVGVNTPGLLRWASMHLPGLLLGLREEFRTISDPETIRMMRINPKLWEAEDLRYGLKVSHTGLSRDLVPERSAAARLARVFGRLRDRLIEELTAGEKLFIWRPLGYLPNIDDIVELSDEVARYGAGTLVCVLPDSARAGTALWLRRELIIGYIDRFAPRYQNGKVVQIDHNFVGWGKTCRAVVASIPR